MIGPVHAGTRRPAEVASAAWGRWVLAGACFIFPTDLIALALPDQSPPLSEAERAEAQQWALDLSQIADPEARQATLATAPARWQPTIRHYLAWRLGMAALRQQLPGLCAAATEKEGIRPAAGHVAIDKNPAESSAGKRPHAIQN